MTIHQHIPSGMDSQVKRGIFGRYKCDLGLKSSSSWNDLAALRLSQNFEDLSISDSETTKTKARKTRRESTGRRGSIMCKAVVGQNGILRLKKRVTFADENGLKLAKVKVMTESSSTPPLLSRSIFEQLGHCAEQTVPRRSWTLQFSQPASQYLQFREKLEKNCLSLENVMVEENQNQISGTIKVKNMSFEKAVFLRVTFDRWSTSCDFPANHIPSDEANPRFDTFQFQFPVSDNLPRLCENQERVEFAVCYRCSTGQEFWDNNDSQNYILVSDIRDHNVPSAVPVYTPDFKPSFESFESLTTYRAWRHYASETSYY